MSRFSKIVAFVLVFLLVFQASVPGSFSKIYADALEGSYEAVEDGGNEEAEEIVEGVMLEEKEGLESDKDVTKETIETENLDIDEAEGIEEVDIEEVEGIEEIDIEEVDTEEVESTEELEIDIDEAEGMEDTETDEEEAEDIESQTVVNSNIILYKDTVYKDLYIQSGSLNLNGYKLEVSGSIVHSGGVLNINGGKLFVKGDYRIQRERETNDGVVYERGSGYLSMTNDEDYVCIDGSLIIESNYTNRLTDGILEIKGDLIQKGSYNTFSPSENHWVILSGKSLQTVSFDLATANFNILELNNYSSEGIFFNKPINANFFKDNGCIVKFPNEGRIGWTLYSDQVIEGDLYLGGGTLDLNGYSLQVNGNIIQSSGVIYINGGSLYVDGDYRLQGENTDNEGNKNYTGSIGSLKMTNEKDYLFVNGDFITQSGINHNGYLTNGVMELKGNFLQKRDGSQYNFFCASGEHKLVLSGENFQTITFENSSSSYSCIKSLEIRNTSQEGVEFSSKVIVTGEVIKTSTPIINGKNLHLSGEGKIEGDTWPYDLSIENNQTLEGDFTVEGDLYIYSGSQHLNGYTLQVDGNLIQSGGYIYIEKGKLLVKGDYRKQRENANLTYGYSNAYLIMNSDEDYVLVEGDFVTQTYYSHEGRITAGTLEVKGDFIQKRYIPSNYSLYNFYATNKHKTILSGDKQQSVSFESVDSRFNILEIKNYSDEGVVFLTTVNTNKLIDNGCKITFPNNEVLGWTLTEDEIIEGDLLLGGGYLDLNGYNLTVKGDLIQSAGTVDVKNGKLTVEGDYRIQTLLKEGEGKQYTNSKGYLKMTEEEGYVIVKGDFVTESVHSHQELLTNGVLEVKGNLIQKRPNDNRNLMTTGNHKILLSGGKLQKISFDTSSSGQSSINKLEISNTSKEGVEFLTKVTITGEVKETGAVIKEAKNIYLQPDANIDWENWDYDISFEGSWTLREDISLKKSLYIRSGYVNLNRNKLSIGENLILSNGRLIINGGKLFVGKDFRVQTETIDSEGQIVYDGSYGYIQMTGKEDYILVNGSFVIQSYYDNGNNRFTAGVLEVKGDFIQKNYIRSTSYYNFYATGEHKTILSGNSLQTISFDSKSSKFAILEIKNHSESGVKFTSYLEVDSIIDNGCVIEFVPTGILGWKLSDNETYEGDLNLGGGILDLNGHTLTVTGDFIQTGGSIIANGGELIVGGDAKINKASWSRVKSEDDSEEVVKNIKVEKDFYIEGGTFNLEGYNLKVGGNIIQSSGTINSGQIEAGSNLNVSGGSISSSQIEAGSNLNVSGGSINGSWIDVEGNLYLSGGTININGGQIEIGKNLIQSNGYMYISGGELLVNGDYRIQSEIVDDKGNVTYGDSTGYLYMRNANDKVFVGGNFITQTRYSHSGLFTNGILEVKGDFIQKRNSYYNSARNNFYATDNHKTILSGDSIQRVKFDTVDSRFNILEIKNYSEEGVEFAQSLNANILIDNDCIVRFPGSLATGWKLSEDEVYEGNLYLAAGTLDLNGQSLTIKGDLIQSGGIVDVNGGSLIVEGSYRIETENISEDGQKIYNQSSGRLKMSNPEDIVKVEGDFVTYSLYDHNGYFTEGVLEVKGNFTQRTTNSYNFYPTNNHKLILSGGSLQKVSLSTSSSRINILEIKNTSDEGVEFASQVIVVGKLTNTSTHIMNGENLHLQGNNLTDLEIWEYDISISETHVLDKDIIIEGDLYLKGGTLDLNGHSLTVAGNLIHSNGILNVNGGQLFVEKNYRIQGKNVASDGTVTYGNSTGYLQMRNEEDYVLVGGRFVTQSRYNHGSYLTAGTLEVKGDFFQNYYSVYSASVYNFNATGSHKTILSGTGHQRIAFTNPGSSSFNQLIITKSMEEGYTFNTTPVWRELTEKTVDNQPPTAPQNLTVQENTATTVTLKWDESSDNEKVEGYYIYRNGIRIGTTKTTQYIDQWLAPNTEYKYTVRAFDLARNLSEPSKEVVVKTTVDDEPPSIPEKLAISSKTGSSLTLTWQPSTDNVGVAGYEIYRDDEYIYTSKTTSFTDRNLVEGTTYTYKIRAVDASGNKSGYSNEVSGIPIKPRIVEIDPKDEVTIGGAVEKRMYVYFADSGNMTGSSAVFEYSKDGSDWKKFDGLVYGPYKKDTTLYFYCNWNLESLESETYKVRYTVYDAEKNFDEKMVTYIVDRTPPAKIQNLSAVSSPSGIVLTWDAAVEGDVSHYNIYRLEEGEASWNLTYKINERTTVSYIDTNVQPNTLYRYAVKAVDIFGQEGELSDYAEVTMEEDMIPPTVVAISPANNTTVGKNIQITVKAEDNIEVSSITLKYYDESKDEWVEIDTISTSGVANFLWEDIPLSGEIKVKAVAKDSSGNVSDGTPLRTYYVKDGGPEKITGLNATTYTTNIVLRWNDVSDKDFAYFVVEKKNSPDASYERYGTVVDKLGMNITDLEPQTTYYFRVAAYDIYGNRGEYSDEIEATTTKDTQSPVVRALSPGAGYYKEKISLRGSAVDNVGVSAFVFQISEDMESWTDIEKIELDTAPKTANVNYEFDISGYDEGAYYVRGIAYDKAGNVSTNTFFVEYRIDTTPPMAPPGVKTESSDGEIIIVWDESDDTGIRYYNVYRSEEKEGTYAVVKERLASLGYIDRNVEINKTYYYKVSAVDEAGNESEKSESVEASLKDDVKAPEIISVSPGNNSDLPKNPMIRVLAADNYKLDKVTIEYNDGDDWVLIGSKDLDVHSEVVTFTWDTTGLTNGTYNLRIKSVDKSGNESDYYKVSYKLNVEPPEAPGLAALPGDWKIDLFWTVENKDNLAGFYIYRSIGNNNFYKRIKTIPIDAARIDSYEDKILTPGQVYYYTVEAIDVYGNTSRSNEVSVVPEDNDSYPPVANAGEDKIATVGMEVLFDGRASKDNDSIVKYVWDFGDGTTGAGATPTHVYMKEGLYQVTLTVFDPAGNSSEDTVKVDVRSYREVGVLEVKVIDDTTGKPISGASVYVDFEDDTPAKFTTNSEGTVYVVGKIGNCSVAAYAEGYLPKEVSAQLNRYDGPPVTIAIEKGELIVGKLNVRRMELDEIIEAGIDITAPENQFVYEFEVTLEFERRTLPTFYVVTNGYGQVLDGYRKIKLSSYDDSEEKSPIVYINTIPNNRPDVPPTIAYLVIPGEVRWLKEFFEVSLTLTNMADPQFVIEDARAELNLPKGLSLAPTKKVQSLLVDIGSIAGGETKEVQWIIRGDEKGSYDLEAYFEGRLMPFNDTVNATFKTEEPLEVLAGDAMKLNIMPQEKAYIGEEYYVFFQLTNTSNFPVYNLYFEVDGKPADVPTVHKITKEQIESDKIHQISSGDNIEIPVLMPGESVWFDYTTIIDFEGDPSRHYYVLTNAEVEQKGVIIPTTVTPIPSHIYKYRVITNKGLRVVAQKDDISIIMEKINHPGATIITKHDDLERIETSGISFLPLYYGVTTTAETEGNFEVEINYDITGYQRYKDNLKLYQIKDGQVKDITESAIGADENAPNILTFKGTADDLCYFAIGYKATEAKEERFLEVSTVGDGTVSLNDESEALPVNYKNTFEYGQHVQLVAKENPGSKFAYWEDVKSQSIISTEPVYETTLVSDINIKAVFYRVPTEEITEFTVVFMNKTGRILKSVKVEKNKSAVPPEAPSISGYEFVGWDKDYSNVVKDMVILPVFRRLPDKYSIAVNGGTLSDGKTKGEYQFDMPVSVIADEAEDGMKFSHWEQDGVKISRSREFTFFMPKKDTKLTAIFVEDTEHVDTTPFITLSEDVIVDKDAKNIMFVATRNITEDYELVESGIILFKSDTKIEEEITLETENVLVGKIKNDSTNQFYVRKLNVENEDIWYARAYMIYRDSSGDFVTVYSKNIVEATLEDK